MKRGKVKYFYEIGERVWCPHLKKMATVKELKPKELSAVIKFKGENGLETKQVNFWEIKKERKKDIVYFAKVKESAKIPSKEREDGCYDIYACFDEDKIVIKPGEIKMIPTGITSAFDAKYRLSVRERGSTGITGMARRAGEIDSGYRDEIFVPINNTTNKIIEITKEVEKKTEENNSDIYLSVVKYPYNKAIAQVALEFVPNVNVKEINYEELKNISSKRGMGKLGESGK